MNKRDTLGICADTRLDWVDAALEVLLFAGTVLYLASLPRILGVVDEAHYLHEAKRILGGEVMYRDVFDFITPGWMYLMAGLFWAFGTSITTARIVAAVIQACTVALLYLICRRLGVRRSLAGAAAMAHLAIAHTAWPWASQHWLATLLCVLLLLVCIRAVRGDWRSAFVAGFVVGLLIAVLHQRGLIMGVGAIVSLVAAVLVERSGAWAPRIRQLAVQLLAYAGGVLLVVGPLLAFLVASAGAQPVWEALVVFPLVNYRGGHQSAWGAVGFVLREATPQTFPRVLKYLPLPLLLGPLRILLSSSSARRDTAHVILLLGLATFSMVSIAYYPDFVHIAFIAPILFVAVAENTEWLLRTIPAPAVVRAGLGGLLGLALVVGFAVHLYGVRVRWISSPRTSIASAFGRVELKSPIEAERVVLLEKLLRDVPSRVFYCYPFCTNLYLLLDARNPTRYQAVLPGRYTSPEQVEEIIASLAAAKPPYIAVNPFIVNPKDPIGLYLSSVYEPLSKTGSVAELTVWRRRDGQVPTRSSD